MLEEGGGMGNRPEERGMLFGFPLCWQKKGGPRLKEEVRLYSHILGISELATTTMVLRCNRGQVRTGSQCLRYSGSPVTILLTRHRAVNDTGQSPGMIYYL
jgi:hypothetical protein